MDKDYNIRWTNRPTAQEDAILKACFESLPIGAVFTDHGLYREFCLSLQRNNLLADTERSRLNHVRPGITLCAVAAMHQVELVLDDGATAFLHADVTGGLIGVSAATQPGGEIGLRNIVFRMLDTDLKAKEWCDNALISNVELFITQPIEVNADQRLVPIR